MIMNNILLVEKNNINENDKPLSKLFLKNRIYLDNLQVENSLCYEDMLTTFLRENKFKFSDDEVFNQRVNVKMLFEIVYEFFRNLDSEMFTDFFNLFANNKKNLIFVPVSPTKSCVGITYQRKDDVVIKMNRYKTIKDIFTLVHEYGHAINMKKNPDSYYDPVHQNFEEIESVFLELILCDYLEKQGFDKEDIDTMKIQIIEDLTSDVENVYFKYKINKFMHEEQIKNIDSNFFKELYQKRNITKEELRKVYKCSFEEIIKYVISTFYSLELYDLFLHNKDLALKYYKEIISLKLCSISDYIDVMESKFIVPNESDAFIRPLKK